jgi:hypothetical protein
VASFKERGNYENLSAEDIAMMGYDEGRKQRLSMTYEAHEAHATLSYVITIYEDTGGAHGNTYFRTFTFDRATGESLRLEDIFVEGADYLALLSQLSREKLAASLGTYADTEYVESGTLPLEESFQSWYLEGGALVLLFPPYQVAPYAAGAQEAHILLPELGTTLAPEYR